MFTSESPSAPASATARASSAMSALAGESFAYSGLSRRRACSPYELGDRLRRFVDVGTRQIQLDDLDRVELVDALAADPVVGGREPADGYPQRNFEIAQAGSDIAAKRVDPRVLETDRVQHPTVRLGDPRRRVALARQRGHRLRDEGVERARHIGSHHCVETAARVQDRDGHPAVDTLARSWHTFDCLLRTCPGSDPVLRRQPHSTGPSTQRRT